MWKLILCIEFQFGTTLVAMTYFTVCAGKTEHPGLTHALAMQTESQFQVQISS